MITKALWEAYNSDIFWAKCSNLETNDELILYLCTLLTIVFTPVVLCFDILLFPLELGFVIFKKLILTNEKEN